MKKVVLIFVAVAAVAALSVSSFAQAAGPKGGAAPGQGQGAAGGRGEGMRKRMEEMFKKLNLTADQKKAWEKLSKDQRAELTALRDKNKTKAGAQPSRAEMEKMMKAVNVIREKYQPKFEKILTAKQKETYKKIQEDMKKSFQRGAGGPGGPGGAGAPGGARGGKTGGGKTGGGN